MTEYNYDLAKNFSLILIAFLVCYGFIWKLFPKITEKSDKLYVDVYAYLDEKYKFRKSSFYFALASFFALFFMAPEQNTLVNIIGIEILLLCFSTIFMWVINPAYFFEKNHGL
jgi:hypothetical protein